MNRQFIPLLVLLATLLYGASDASAQIVLGSVPVPAARTSVPFSHTLTATGGVAPYTYAISTVIENGAWAVLSPAGVFSGTPPSTLGGLDVQLEITVTDSTMPSPLVLVANVTFTVTQTATLPFTDGYGTTEPLGEQYIVRTNITSNVVMASTVPSFNGNPGNAVIMEGFTPNTNDPSAADINNLANWAMPSTFTGANVAELILPVFAPNASQIAVTFDFLLKNESTTANREHYTNMVLDWSTNLSGPWNLIAGPNANIQPAGMTGNFIYRPAMNPTPGTWTNETVTFSPSGSQQVVYFRIRSCVRFNSSTASVNSWVGIDNLQVTWPLSIANDTQLPNAPATTPYNVQMLVNGGIQPVVQWTVLNHNWPALDPMNPLATLGFEIAVVNNVWFLRSIPPSTVPLSLLTNPNNPFTFELEAKDAGNGLLQSVVTKPFILEVTPAPNPPAIINNVRLSSAGFGTNYEHFMTLNGGVPPLTWTMSEAPAWLSINPTIGNLTGVVPATGTPGTLVLPRIRVTDFNGDFDERVFEIEMVDQLQFIGLAASGMYEFTALETRSERFPILVEGGSAPFAFGFATGSKPNGLDVDPVRGIIFGAPLVGDAAAAPQGVYLFKVSVSDAGSLNALVDVRIEVIPNPVTGLTITTGNSLADAEERIPYEVVFDAIGGNPPYTWAAVPGTLPPGMTLTTAGFLTGVPDDGSANTYNMQVSVTDAMLVIDSLTFVIVVTQDTLPPKIITTTIPGAEVGKFYSATILLQDGVAPFTWQIISAPSWLSVTTGGQAASITGRPTKDDLSGTIELSVSDSNPLGIGSDSVLFNLTIAPYTGQIVKIDDSQLPNNRISTAKEDEVYNFVMPVFGGVGPFKWSIIGGALPGGLFLQATGSIVGKPSINTAGTRTVTFRVVDAAGFADTKDVTVEVLPVQATGPVEAVGNVSLDGNDGGCSLGSSGSPRWFWLALGLLSTAVVVTRRRRA